MGIIVLRSVSPQGALKGNLLYTCCPVGIVWNTVFLRLNAAAFNRQGYCSAAAFIRGRRLIEGGVY